MFDANVLKQHHKSEGLEYAWCHPQSCDSYGLTGHISMGMPREHLESAFGFALVNCVLLSFACHLSSIRAALLSFNYITLRHAKGKESL